MIVIGLTGSIGMGKSTAARMFRRMGIPVFDSDSCVRQALSNNGDVQQAVVAAFPKVWDTAAKTIDRKKLGAIVFDDAVMRKRLEGILHPVVRRAQKTFIAGRLRMGQKTVVLDIPLLFETGAERRVDYTICVTAPYRIQRARVLARPAMDEARFHKILCHQMPDVEKRAMADFVVQTGLGYGLTFRQLQAIIREIRGA